MELPGRRITLREFEAADAPVFEAILDDPRHREHYGPDEGEAGHARRLVECFRAWACESPRRNYQLAVTLHGALIGSCGLRGHGRPEGEAEFGLGLAADAWGRGYGTEAARLLLDYGFGALGLREVVGVSVSANERVNRLVARLGFTRAGTRPGPPWMQERGWMYTEWRLEAGAWRSPARQARR
jgi:ribosomal-protein-alanine N-acetyltransferase